MWQIARANSFPGVTIRRGGLRPGPHSLWERIQKSFRARSTDSTEWIAGICSAAFDTYVRLNKAIAAYVPAATSSGTCADRGGQLRREDGEAPDDLVVL